MKVDTSAFTLMGAAAQRTANIGVRVTEHDNNLR